MRETNKYFYKFIHEHKLIQFIYFPHFSKNYSFAKDWKQMN